MNMSEEYVCTIKKDQHHAHPWTAQRGRAGPMWAGPIRGWAGPMPAAVIPLPPTFRLATSVTTHF